MAIAGQAIAEVVSTDRGVLAVAARGRLAAQVRSLLQDHALEPTFQLGTSGDLALVLREQRELVVRLEGRAQVLLRRDGGRLTWLDAGISHYPLKTVTGVILTVGIDLGAEARGAIEAWLMNQGDPAELPELHPALSKKVVALVVDDQQQQTVRSEDAEDDEGGDGLLDLLAEVAEWDDRATPAMVRREAGPQSGPKLSEIAPWVFGAPPISTAEESGPPFRPVMLLALGDPSYEQPSFSRAAAALEDRMFEEPEHEASDDVEDFLPTETGAPDRVAESIPPVEEPSTVSPVAHLQPRPSPADVSQPPLTVEAPRHLDDPRTPFSIDPYQEPPVTPADLVDEPRVPLWAALMFAGIVIGTTFAVAWLYLLA